MFKKETCPITNNHAGGRETDKQRKMKHKNKDTKIVGREERYVWNRKKNEVIAYSEIRKYNV
jgi:hypothetical protein